MKKILSLCMILMLVCLPSCSDLGTDNEDTYVEITEEYFATEKITTSTPTNTLDISDFSIVFNDDQDMKMADYLRKKIMQRSHVELKSYRDIQSQNIYEFLIGNTGREISEEYFGKETNEIISKYGYIIDGTKIFFAGLDNCTIEKSIDSFVNDYIKNNEQITVEEYKNTVCEIDLEGAKIPVRSKNDDIRLVSHNVIAMYLKYAAHSYRVEQLQVLYTLLSPDVIAVQECDQLWFSQYHLNDALENIGYKLAPIDDSATNRIFYREETIKLLDSGMVEYADSYENSTNTYGWALLEQISSGKRYVQISTHLPAHGKWREAREQAELLVEDVKKIEEAGYPVVSCGDYNSTHNTYEMKIIKKHMKSARDDCKVKVNMKFHTENDGGTGNPPKLGDAIDHCFYSTSGIVAEHFETLIGKYAYLSSDHLPILLDFILE